VLIPIEHANIDVAGTISGASSDSTGVFTLEISFGISEVHVDAHQLQNIRPGNQSTFRQYRFRTFIAFNISLKSPWFTLVQCSPPFSLFTSIYKNLSPSCQQFGRCNQ